MKIGIDMDDVLAALNQQIIKYINRRDGSTFSFDHIVSYDFSVSFSFTPERAFNTVFEFYKSPEFFETVPVEGAQEAIKILRSRHKLYVITSRNEDLRAETEDWLTQYFGDSFEQIILTNHYTQNASHVAISKGEVGKLLGIDLMIEDALQNADNVASHGIEVLLMNRPWNQTKQLHDRIVRTLDWPQAVNFINSKQEFYENNSRSFN